MLIFLSIQIGMEWFESQITLFKVIFDGMLEDAEI